MRRGNQPKHYRERKWVISILIEIEEGVEERREGLTKTETQVVKWVGNRVKEGVVVPHAHPRSTVVWFQR